MEEWEHVDRDSNEFNLIDFSSENDNLYFSVSPVSHQQQFQECQGASTGFETVGYMDSGNRSEGNDQLEQVPQLAQSEEPQRIGGGKCARLDPEELTSMMDGREAVQKQFLPGIQEDMQQSTDSISTFESDNFTLESLEVELFADIRASIQKSSTTAKGSFGKNALQKDGGQDISSPNEDSVSQNQPKSKLGIKKIVGVHKRGVPECQSKVNTVIQGSNKEGKTESGRSVVPRSAVTIGESASSLAKPPYRSSKSSSTASSGTKASFLGPSHHKTENGNAKTVVPRVASLSKSSSTTSSGTKVTSLCSSRLKSGNGNTKSVALRGSHESTISTSNGPSKILPMSGSTSKSSSRKASMDKTRVARSSFEDASCNSPLPKDEVKPSSASVRRKAPSKAVHLPSPTATPQSSSTFALKNKVASNNSDLASYLISSEVPSSISPASSVSEWSTSSSSAVNQRSHKSRSSVGSSCRSEVGEALPFNRKASTNNPITRSQEIKRSAESVKKPVLQAGVISGSSSTKPTALRMPSPKIGYFDGVKSVHAASGASSKGRPGVSHRGISNLKHKVGKLPPGRVVTATKHETQNPDVPLPAQGNSQVSPRNGDHEKQIVESPVKNVQENGSEEHEHDKVIPKGNVSVMKNEMMLVGPELNESKTDKVSPKENIGVTKNEMMLVDAEHNESRADSCEISTNTPESLDAFKIDGHYDLVSSLNSCCKISEKENVPWEDQMDQSSKDGGGSIKSETVDLQTIELAPVTCSEVS